MTLGRVGGGLMILGIAGLPFTLAPGAALFAAADLVLAGVGGAFVSVAGPRPLDARLMRGGLGLLAAGVLGGAVGTVNQIGYDGDPLGSLAIMGPLIFAWAAIPLGTLAVAISLVRFGGLTRALGVAMVLGVLLVVPGGVLFGEPGRTLGVGLVGLGLAGVSSLALGIRWPRWAEDG